MKMRFFSERKLLHKETENRLLFRTHHHHHYYPCQVLLVDEVFEGFGFGPIGAPGSQDVQGLFEDGPRDERLLQFAEEELEGARQRVNVPLGRVQEIVRLPFVHQES